LTVGPAPSPETGATSMGIMPSATCRTTTAPAGPPSPSSRCASSGKI